MSALSSMRTSCGWQPGSRWILSPMRRTFWEATWKPLDQGDMGQDLECRPAEGGEMSRTSTDWLEDAGSKTHGNEEKTLTFENGGNVSNATSNAKVSRTRGKAKVSLRTSREMAIPGAASTTKDTGTNAWGVRDVSGRPQLPETSSRESVAEGSSLWRGLLGISAHAMRRPHKQNEKRKRTIREQLKNKHLNPHFKKKKKRREMVVKQVLGFPHLRVFACVFATVFAFICFRIGVKHGFYFCICFLCVCVFAFCSLLHFVF